MGRTHGVAAGTDQEARRIGRGRAKRTLKNVKEVRELAEDVKRCRGNAYGAGIGSLWFIGWLFSIGFIGMHFWKAVLALIIWPYFLGVALR
jgi:hypothetical protein